MPSAERCPGRVRPWSRPTLLLAAALSVCALGWLALAAAPVSSTEPPPLIVDAGSFPVIHLYVPPAAGVEAPAAAQPAPDALTTLRTVLENGQPVRLSAVDSAAAHLPLTAVLVLDTSGSIRPALDQIKASAADFIARLAEGDLAGLIQFSSQVHVLAAPTLQRAPLRQGLAALRAEGGTALYDAVKEGVAQVQRGLAGGATAARLGAVVLLTDGRDEDVPGQPGSVTRLEPLKALLRQSGVPVYSLGLGREVDRDVLTQIADASLGQAYFAEDSGGVQALFDRVFTRLRGTRGVAYLSPNLSPDGTLRSLILNFEGGIGAAASYTAPLHPDLVWRYVPERMPSAAPCLPGAISTQGRALLGDPPMLLHGGAVTAGLSEGVAPPPWFVERAALLEDGTAYLIGAAASQRYRLDEAVLRPLPQQVPEDLGAEGWQVVALSPGGSHELLFRAGPSGAGSQLAAVQRGEGAGRLLWRAPCPGRACDRLAGAAISDTGTALINQTGSLYRLDAQGRTGPARREVFYGSVALAADGRTAAAIVWLPAPGRVLVMDDAMRAVEARPVQTGAESLPPVVALSPLGRYVAVLDDLQLSVQDRQRPRWQSVPLGSPPPAGRCERTLQVDDSGQVLYADGRGLVLHRGFSGPWK